MLRLGITTIPPRSSNQHTNVTAWAFVVKPPLLRPVSSWYPPFLPRWHAGGLWSWCCPASALFRPPNPAQSGLWGYLPILQLLSRHGTGCTHFAMARTAPADPSMVFRCSANTGLRWAFHGCFFLAGLLAAFFQAETYPWSYSIVVRLFHVFSCALFYHLCTLYSISKF